MEIGFTSLSDKISEHTLHFTITHTHSCPLSRIHYVFIASYWLSQHMFPFLWVLEMSPASATSTSLQQLPTTEPQVSNSPTDWFR
jgi:hypothetical protein